MPVFVQKFCFLRHYLAKPRAVIETIDIQSSSKTFHDWLIFIKILNLIYFCFIAIQIDNISLISWVLRLNR